MAEVSEKLKFMKDSLRDALGPPLAPPLPGGHVVVWGVWGEPQVPDGQPSAVLLALAPFVALREEETV